MLFLSITTPPLPLPGSPAVAGRRLRGAGAEAPSGFLALPLEAQMAPDILPNHIFDLPGASQATLGTPCGQLGAQEAPRSNFRRFWNDFGTPEP